MSSNDQDEVAKKVEAFEKSLLKDKRNPNAKHDFEKLVERASQPLLVDKEKQHKTSRYNEKQTHSHMSTPLLP